jgi:hypothetical protein
VKIIKLVHLLCGVVIASFTCTGASAAIAPTPRTHCGTEEVIIFNCSFKNKKTISMCANQTLTSQSGSLQYRYGVIGRRPELKYPISTNESYKSFTMLSSSSGKWHDRKINFKINDFSYSILSYENTSIPESEFSISIFKNQKKIKYLNCLKNSIQDETWILIDILK